jgi:hypothetical protein
LHFFWLASKYLEYRIFLLMWGAGGQGIQWGTQSTSLRNELGYQIWAL